MFYLFFFGTIVYIIIFFVFKIKRKQTYHYFILIKDGEGMIEGVIRSIHFRSWIEGRTKKITVFDLGSKDDTLDILERLIYPKKKINYLFTSETKSLSFLRGLLIESLAREEQPVILYFKGRDKRTSVRKIYYKVVKAGKSS